MSHELGKYIGRYQLIKIFLLTGTFLYIHTRKLNIYDPLYSIFNAFDHTHQLQEI